jgi:hypothetical protein
MTTTQIPDTLRFPLLALAAAALLACAGGPEAGAQPGDAAEPGEAAGAAPEPGGKTEIDGRWRLAALIDTRFPSTVNMVYTLEKGKGSLVKDGEPHGDGFTYTLDGDKVRVEDATDEGLLDAGQMGGHYPHYHWEITETAMIWWVADPMSPVDRKDIYIFQKR